MSNECHDDSGAAPIKVALITAGSAGLGAQIARVLAPDFRIVSQYPSLTRSYWALLTVPAVHQLHE